MVPTDSLDEIDLGDIADALERMTGTVDTANRTTGERIAVALSRLADGGAPDPIVTRIAVALERIGDLVATLLAEPEPGDERTGEPDPEPPIDAWVPRKCGRAMAATLGGIRFPVVVDRFYETEGETIAVVVDKAGNEYRLPAETLIEPRT